MSSIYIYRRQRGRTDAHLSHAISFRDHQMQRLVVAFFQRPRDHRRDHLGRDGQHVAVGVDEVLALGGGGGRGAQGGLLRAVGAREDLGGGRGRRAGGGARRRRGRRGRGRGRRGGPPSLPSPVGVRGGGRRGVAGAPGAGGGFLGKFARGPAGAAKVPPQPRAAARHRRRRDGQWWRRRGHAHAELAGGRCAAGSRRRCRRASPHLLSATTESYRPTVGRAGSTTEVTRCERPSQSLSVVVLLQSSSPVTPARAEKVTQRGGLGHIRARHIVIRLWPDNDSQSHKKKRLEATQGNHLIRFGIAPRTVQNFAVHCTHFLQPCLATNSTLTLATSARFRC